MRLEAKKYLYDVRQAGSRIAEFTSGKTLNDFSADAMLRSAVQRQFEIIGEAPMNLAKVDENVAARISQHRRIIAFRNILIHGYAVIDDRLVWDIVQAKLPILREEIDHLLDET